MSEPVSIAIDGSGWDIPSQQVSAGRLCLARATDSGYLCHQRPAYGAGLQIALGAAMETAAAISTRSPDAIRSIKQLINSAWKMSDEEALALEAKLQLGVLGEQNQLEAVAANVKKRAPVFRD